MLEAATARLDGLLADAQRLIEVESPSEDLEAVARSARVTAEVVGARFAEVGLPAAPEWIDVEGCQHLRWAFGERTRVLVVAHHDTVWPLGTLDRIPFAIEDGVLTGPGCFDMIVGLAQAVHAIAALAAADGPRAIDGVTLLVTGDEEIGSPTSREVIEQTARGADAALVLEASGDGGALKTARKGVSWYELEAVGRAAHSGLEPASGINAGAELAHLILAMSRLEHADAGTTVTPTRGSIGTTGNTVPAAARVMVDVRARTRAEQERVDAEIRAIAPTVPGAAIVVHGGINRPPLERALALDLFEAAARLAPLAGIERLDEIAVGGASDGNFTAGVGVPTLDGLGAVGGGAHAENEHVLVAHIPQRTALLALLIQEVLAR